MEKTLHLQCWGPWVLGGPREIRVLINVDESKGCLMAAFCKSGRERSDFSLFVCGVCEPESLCLGSGNGTGSQDTFFRDGWRPRAGGERAAATEATLSREGRSPGALGQTELSPVPLR
uniref:Uncharacterized protein n=1 Tax=Malurus cyaneus samueli TaxID=2593467 RepID=A0A8C5U971_9PASS